MQEQKYEELADRASAFEKAEKIDFAKQLEARERVLSEIQKMKDEGEALVLSDEELAMLKSFRRFKLRMQKNGEVFKWQSAISDKVEIAAECGLIRHPQEVE